MVFVCLFVEGTRRVRDGDIYIYRRSIKEGTWSATRTSQAVSVVPHSRFQQFGNGKIFVGLVSAGDFILSQVGILF